MTDSVADADTAAPRVSVIIPHLNMPEALDRCLRSVFAQHLDHGGFEVIVVDNGSRVSLTAIKAAWPTVHWLEEPRPGPGLARNKGITIARAPVLAFIDADCRADVGWLQAAVSAVEAAPPARGVVGGDVRIDFIDPRRLTGIEAYEAVFAYRQRMYIERQNFSGTGNLAMAAPVHAEVGPFAGIDTAEDRDWGQRATAAGYTIRYVDGMRVFHPGRTDFEGLEKKWRRHIRHDWNDRRAAGRGALGWSLRAGAMLASIPVEALRILGSSRLSGLANRARGIAVLARIRAFRCAEMLRVMTAAEESGATFWNRQ